MDYWLDHSELTRATGNVIPVYFSAAPSDEVVSQLLWMTLGDCDRYLSLENVWVVVDGDSRTARLLNQVRDQLLHERGSTFSLIPLPENRGKLWAIKEGVTALLKARPLINYVVIRDSDGDHVASDMPSLVRTAAHLSHAYGNSRVIVIGSRRSRHRPMGWIRGELEPLLDQVTLDALAYRLASEERGLQLSHCLGNAVPDLSSGYKVYGRQIAQELFLEHTPVLACLSDEDYWHYGPETVTIVEGILRGAVIAEVQRFTWNGQPATSFGEFKHVSLYGELLAWVYVRLGIPLQVAANFYDSFLPSMSLQTTAQGRDIVASVRRHTLEKTRSSRGETAPIPSPAPVLPFL